MGKRELIALLNLSSWCLVMAERLFLAVPRGCLQFVIVVFPDHTHLLFLTVKYNIGLKTFLQQVIPEPIFNGGLVYKFKIMVGNPHFSHQFTKIFKRFKKKG